MIGFVVKTGQVQHAVQHQDLDFFRRRVAQPARILRGDLRRDRNLSSEAGDWNCAGNDKTSVAWSLPRNRAFRLRISRLLVISTVTRPRNPTARRARARKRSSAAALTPATGLFTITMPAKGTEEGEAPSFQFPS